jgi:hypothetical protein
VQEVNSFPINRKMISPGSLESLILIFIAKDQNYKNILLICKKTKLPENEVEFQNTTLKASAASIAFTVSTI